MVSGLALAFAVGLATGFVSAEFLTVIAMVVMLVVVPLFVIAVIAVVSAYLQYDAERYLEDLADEEPPADDGSH